ncbi:recombinase family protein [Streptomyces sp. WM6378]|uniref:recombinase family protein n=1 Tax=Streptomyces sp. WM6378 TaxID=1415557 RepID=UPI001F363066|nr:recombinase family protein [Streptomyces sp. WM6378]
MYARQSEARPDSSEASPEAQLAAGAAPAAGRGWEVVHTFKDVGRSGWDPNAVRPGSEDLMSAVRAGEVDVAVVNELSRLTRKGAHGALEIDKEFKNDECASLSVEPPLPPEPDDASETETETDRLRAELAELRQERDIRARRDALDGPSGRRWARSHGWRPLDDPGPPVHPSPPKPRPVPGPDRCRRTPLTLATRSRAACLF